MNEALKSLIERLERCAFTGSLNLRFSEGQVQAAELNQYLQTVEFTAGELPGIESEGDFVLKP
jgi:hypothetical protein